MLKPLAAFGLAIPLALAPFDASAEITAYMPTTPSGAVFLTDARDETKCASETNVAYLTAKRGGVVVIGCYKIEERRVLLSWTVDGKYSEAVHALEDFSLTDYGMKLAKKEEALRLDIERSQRDAQELPRLP